MENYINLMDGTRIEAHVNFATIYYLEESGAVALQKKLKEKEDKGIKPTDMESMKMASKVMYSILRSNGKKVTVDEAMALIPPDTSEIENIMNIFQSQLENYKKKENAKQTMKTMSR